MRLGGLEEEKIDIKIDPKVTTAVIDELLEQFSYTVGKPMTQVNFTYI
jgi:hypothetical protein